MSRPNVKTLEVTHFLRRQIVDGDLPPGARLPDRGDLEDQFGVSRITIQRAMNALRNEGFIQSRGRLGTFVRTAPPHRVRYALLFWAKAHQRRSYYWEALTDEARRLAAERERLQIATYFGIERSSKAPEYRELLQQVRDHRLAGLIFGSQLSLVNGSPLLEDPTMPRVSMHSAGLKFGIPFVRIDRDAWLDRAFEKLASGGCRRVAVFASGRTDDEKVAAAAQRWGLELPPEHRLYLPWSVPEGPRHVASLLMSRPADQRPDGIAVLDDHLIEAVSLGLLDAGVGRDADRLPVIAHANFPNLPNPAVPVSWLGYSARRIVERCVELIDRQRDKQNVPRESVIEPVFEHELALEGPDVAEDDYGDEASFSRAFDPVFAD